jgi:catecholate siderophore receptor
MRRGRRAGLIYQPLPALSLYASLSQSFLPRGRTAGVLDAQQQCRSEPERFRSVEAGAGGK